MARMSCAYVKQNTDTIVFWLFIYLSKYLFIYLFIYFYLFMVMSNINGNRKIVEYKYTYFSFP